MKNKWQSKILKVNNNDYFDERLIEFLNENNVKFFHIRGSKPIYDENDINRKRDGDSFGRYAGDGYRIIYR